MTTANLSHLPLAAGSALLHSAGRVGLWAISHYFRAPLANTGILAMMTLTAMAGSNALYHQTARHPAPFFAPAVAETAAVEEDMAVPAVRQSKPRTVAPQVTENTGSINPQAVPENPIGNEEVFALQKKLLELGFFEGTVDGYYGPKTAASIRAFELKMGLKPQGALTREITETILRSSSIEAVATQPAEPVQQVQVAQQPVAETPVQQPVRQLAVITEPAPQLLVQKPATRQVQTLRIVPQPAVSQQSAAPVAADPAEEVFDAAADTAAGTFDAIAGMVQDLAETRTVNQVPAQQTPARVASIAPQPQPVVAAAPTQMAATAPAEVAASTDVALVAKVQRGLASLGFLAGSIDGVAGEATSKAIRNFEVYYNYNVTGEITPELVGMLKAAGAAI